MTDEIEECYRLFELEPGAGAEAVKQAYRELLKVWHPDRFPDAKLQKRATEKAKALNEAYHKITAYLSDACTEPRASAKARVPVEDDMQATEAEDDFVEEEDFAWTLKSAQGGNSWSQRALAEMYLEGTKIPKNEAEAFRWYLAAASQGDSDGMYFVGKSYLEGLGVERDKKEAIKWLSRLAYPETTEDWFCACGSSSKMHLAQISMVQIYYKIPGEPHDPATAYGWLLLAICYGQPSSVKVTQYDTWKLEWASILQQMKKKLESELTAEQRAKGQKMAAELFRPKDYLEAKAERMEKEQEAVAERSLKEDEDGPRSSM